MTPNEWMSSCNGPYLSFNVAQFTENGHSQVIAQENSSRLFLIMKKQGTELIVPDEVIKDNDLSLLMDFGPNCIISGCFLMKATQLTDWSQVGTLQGNNLITTNQSGFLFYGPYTRLAAGKYYLILNGEYGAVPSATLDITSDGAQVVHLVAHLSDFQVDTSSPLVLSFEIPSDVLNLEVRLHVSELDIVRISDYEIILQQESTLQPTKLR